MTIISYPATTQEIQRLPPSPGINIGRVEYLRAERVRDRQLEQALIREGVEPNITYTSVSYVYNKVDLNGDGHPEAIVSLKSPAFCGTGGCLAYIFRSNGRGYREKVYESLTYGTIVIAPQKNSGWNNLIRPYRNWERDRWVIRYGILRFNGREYTGISNLPRNSTLTGTVALASDYEHSLQPSPNEQQTATGRSLLVAANAQSIRGVTVPPAEKSPSRLADGYGFFLDKPNAKKLDDGTLIYSFDVYNLGYADGVIEVYDSRNNLIEVRGIEGFRNPATNLYAYPVEGVNRLFRLATEGYGVLDLRNAFGRAKKTEIRNIAIPRGGRLIFTWNSERAIIYNQATFVMGVLADSVLSKFPSGDHATLKANILSSLFIELQKERVGSLLRDGMLLTAQDSRRAFANQSWIEEQNLSKLMEIGSKVFAQELLKYGVERTVVEQLVLGKKLSFWVTAAEITVQGSNAFLQWLDLERSRKWEQEDGQPFGISNLS